MCNNLKWRLCSVAFNLRVSILFSNILFFIKEFNECWEAFVSCLVFSFQSQEHFFNSRFSLVIPCRMLGLPNLDSTLELSSILHFSKLTVRHKQFTISLLIWYQSPFLICTKLANYSNLFSFIEWFQSIGGGAFSHFD